MWEEAVPKVDWEVWVGGAESRDEVIFECPDGAFGGVASVGVWWDELIFEALCFHEGFDDVGAFVVQ